MKYCSSLNFVSIYKFKKYIHLCIQCPMIMMGTTTFEASLDITDVTANYLQPPANSSILPAIRKTMVDQNTWMMSQPLYAVTMTLLSVEAAVGLLSNTLLIATIRYSPTLRTPANNQLISICVNNLLLVLNIIISLWSLNIPVSSQSLRNIQLFLVTTSWLQYWCIFCAIGFYRCTTLMRPSMSQVTRKGIIYRSIWIGWLLSSTGGAVLTVSFRHSSTIITWNPFRRSIVFTGFDVLAASQNIAILLVFGGFIIGLVILFSSYYRIFRTLYNAMGHSLGTNRVHPMARNPSLSTDGNDLIVAKKKYYRTAPPHATFPSSSENTFTVHFNKRHQSVTMDVLALENPLAVRRYYQNPGAQRDTSQHASKKKETIPPKVILSQPEFTDISQTAEMQRIQMFATNCALRNNSVRRDRISLGGATKNSLVMMVTFFVFSCPMVICSIPGLLNAQSAHDIMLPSLFCKLVFFLNAPAYPIWYLVFSRRVRKGLSRLFSHIK